jgi:hypothetical protein
VTYQNLGYWVGQANDNSTGNHPTGWTTGQRWSETAGEWQTMYNTEYVAARDTSTGQHPTGWASGQLWSVTATQWNGMWNTEYTNARDNSAGQSSGGLGPQHPTGYATGQQWSVTAQQWCDMWAVEWRAARDPANQTYSYPGQPANAVYWSQTAQYWKGQADYYWGPSRQWSNGSTWEQLYNNYVGYYNDMVSQRDTWINRANSAWGPSRVWPNGESWEAAYNRVLPIATPYVMAQGWNCTVDYPDFGQQVSAFAPDRPGYWLIIMRGTCDNGGHGGGMWYRIDIDGVGGSVDTGYTDAGGDESVHSAAGLRYGPVAIGPGNAIRTYANKAEGSFTGTTYAYFIPSQQYPH